ncbi:MAG: YigZ family protein [Ignavibacteriaceae bacterium]|nr:YigZ family protein [Ignavibacteriaceae bacterium]
MIEEYLTLKSEIQAEIKEKGSLFLSKAVPFDTVEEFQNYYSGIRKQFYDATHHCYAFKLIDGTFKYSDDGEPSGTAGIRIFNAIEHNELNNCGIIVIRYYGGTKLGTGPLGKAYYEAANLSIKNSEIIKLIAYEEIEISLPFEHSKTGYKLLKNDSIKIIDTIYSEQIVFKVLSKPAFIPEIEEKLTQILKGENPVCRTGKVTYH